MDRAAGLRARRLPAIAGGLLLAGYAAFLQHHVVSSVGGSDVYSYVSAGRALLEGRILRPASTLSQLDLPVELDRLFIPLGAAPGRVPGTMVSVVPIGLPLHMAAVGLAAGADTGPFLASPLAALAMLVLLYLLAREMGLPPSWSLAAPAILAAFPGFLHAAVMPMSDALAACWACATVLCALRARRRPGFAALSGAAFVVGCLVRHSNVLLAVPLLFALPRSFRAWRLFAVGGAGPAFLAVAYNVVAFGTFLTTGYGAIWGEISPAFFAARLAHYARWTWTLFSPLVLTGWLACVLDRRGALRERLLLLSWFGVFLVFYCCLLFQETGWHTRYLLPGLPALILGALIFGRRLLSADWLPIWGGRALALAALLLVLGTGVRFIAANRVHKSYKLETLYPRAARFVESRVPARSLVLSMQMSGALEYYTDVPFVMWNWLPPGDPPAALLRNAAARGYKWYGLLAPFELEDARSRMPGTWREVATIDDVTLWEIVPAAGKVSP